MSKNLGLWGIVSRTKLVQITGARRAAPRPASVFGKRNDAGILNPELLALAGRLGFTFGIDVDPQDQGGLEQRIRERTPMVEASNQNQ